MTACGAALAATALLASVAGAQPSHDQPTGAVFVETDSAHNQVVSYARAADGTLRLAGTYDTLGAGGVLDQSVVDHTASEGAVALDTAHHLLFAVNAGSDTVTVFAVHGDSLTRLQVVRSGGSFPVSVVAHGNVVFVLNARDGGSIQSYVEVAGRLVPTFQRGLHLNEAGSPEFTHTPGQVAVTPDGRDLVVTTKASTNAIDTFPIGLFGLLGQPAVTSLPGAVPFAVSFDGTGHLDVAEAGPSALATFGTHDGVLRPAQTVATGQQATCWVAADGRYVFTANAGSASVSGYRVAADGTLTALGNTATDAGTVDPTVSGDGRYLYVRTGQDGDIDEFRVGSDGSLTRIGSLTVPDSAGAEGIAAS